MGRVAMTPAASQSGHLGLATSWMSQWGLFCSGRGQACCLRWRCKTDLMKKECVDSLRWYCLVRRGDQSGGEIARMAVWVFLVWFVHKKSIASWKRESLGRRLLMGVGWNRHQQPQCVSKVRRRRLEIGCNTARVGSNKTRGRGRCTC